MDGLSIFPLKIVKAVALLYFTGVPAGGAGTRILFSYLHQKSVSTLFIIEGTSRDSTRSLVLAVSTDELERFAEDLEDLRTVMRAAKLTVEKPVALIRVLGPHFDIHPGIAGTMFSKLLSAGIEVLANSTTITSSLLAIPEGQLERALRALKSVFCFRPGPTGQQD